MNGQIAIPDNLRFHCPSCRAELSVPMRLAGVEGPCPSCFENIQAPVPEAMYSEVPVLPLMPPLLVTFPPPRGYESQAIPHLPRAAPPDAEFSASALERNFKARLAIPPQEEPLDDTWKDRHRQKRRQTRRTRKAEDAAHSFLQSRGFQVARVALIMLSGAMLVWLFQYLQSHQWSLPGKSPAMAEEKKDGGNTAKAAGPDASEPVSDDDTEIPAAANHVPASTGPAQPVAGRKAP